MLNLTPEIAVAIYELLRHCPPFNKWHLPHADDIEFCITAHEDRHADSTIKKRKKLVKRRIRVSSAICHSLRSTIEAIAHEMCHLRQYDLGAWRENHGPVFKRLAKQVCKIHGFERGTF